MSVRAKFICTDKFHTTADPSVGNVKLSAVSGGSEDNESYFQHTPFGAIEIGTLNSTAFAQFEPGKEYYVDFTLAE